MLAILLVVGIRCLAATFQEDFSTDPHQRGWSHHGNSNLFHWNAVQQRLEVMWDSTQPNSYFRRPLQTILAKTDSFSLSFDLYLQESAIGITPDKPYSFEIALGFHNSISATRTNFQRGRGVGSSPNLVEFDYFPEYYNPDDIFSHQATVWPALISTNGSFNYDSANSYMEVVLPTNTWMRLQMNYDATARQLLTTIRTNAGPFITGQEGAILTQLTVRVMASFSDYRVDLFSISSYSDTGGTGSLRARGWVDNVSWTVPDAPVQNLSAAFANGQGQADFDSLAGWLYTSEASTNLMDWHPASVLVPGTGGRISVPASQPAGAMEYFRVNAIRP